MLRRIVATAVIPASFIVTFFVGTLVGDSTPGVLPGVTPKPVKTTKTWEGDTRPMPPLGKMPWNCLPTGHDEG